MLYGEEVWKYIYRRIVLPKTPIGGNCGYSKNDPKYLSRVL